MLLYLKVRSGLTVRNGLTVQNGLAAGWFALVLGLAGCAGSEPTVPGPGAGLSCVDDSSHCIGQREKAFDALMADKSRGWVKQPASPEAYGEIGRDLGNEFAKRCRKT